MQTMICIGIKFDKKKDSFEELKDPTPIYIDVKCR